MAEPLLEVRRLKKYYAVRRGMLRQPGWVRAVDDVSFHIAAGETLGLVGESGCGKTTTGRTILRLVEPTAGEVLFRGVQNKHQPYPLFRLGKGPLRALRRHMQIIFQDPYGSLNPRLSVQATLEEGMIVHGLGNRRARRAKVAQLLQRVGLDAGAAAQYPHAFSGGQRQRIGIARALAVDPEFVVCDEPVSALDVSVQAQVLNLLLDLQRERNLAYLFISHDLAVVSHMSHRIAVMYGGQIVETGPSADVCSRPAHPYTRALLASVPQGLAADQPAAAAPSAAEKGALLPVGGCRDQLRVLGQPHAEREGNLLPACGCRYQPRCPVAVAECARVEPPLIQVGTGHEVRCHLAQK